MISTKIKEYFPGISFSQLAEPEHNMENDKIDNVNSPKHYASGKIEVIEAIEDWKLSHKRGDAVKYIARAGKKDSAKEIEDLEKAVWYINREIEILKAIKEGREPRRPNEMVKKEDTSRFGQDFTYEGRWGKFSTGVIAFIPEDSIINLRQYVGKSALISGTFKKDTV